MNCANRQPDGEPCGHSELQHETLPDGTLGRCEVCACGKCVFTFRADEEGNVRPPSVEISIERGDEATTDFDTSDIDDEDTKP